MANNLDELLMQSPVPQAMPETPDSVPENDIDIPADDVPEAESDYEDDFPSAASFKGEPEEKEDAPEPPEEASDNDVDDYGNPKAKPRTYSEDEVNERINKAIRDRLSRGTQAAQNTQVEAVKAAAGQNFEYDANNPAAWEHQLEQFVLQTLDKAEQKRVRQIEQFHQQEVEEKMQRNINSSLLRFSDFEEVVSKQPITPAIRLALEGMADSGKDPGAFIYTASKNAPDELKRISQMPNAYAQMVEIGKLEERMRKTKATSNAPRPANKHSEDVVNSRKDSKKEKITDPLAAADAKRLYSLKRERGSVR